MKDNAVNAVDPTGREALEDYEGTTAAVLRRLKELRIGSTVDCVLRAITFLELIYAPSTFFDLSVRDPLYYEEILHSLLVKCSGAYFGGVN